MKSGCPYDSLVKDVKFKEGFICFLCAGLPGSEDQDGLRLAVHFLCDTKLEAGLA